jgi:hypothetical protein
MSDSIDTRVTPSFHPETVQALDGYDENTASILSGVESAFTDAYVSIGRVHDARNAAKTNPTWNEAQQIIEVANFADKLTANLAKKFDSATANLTRVVEGLERDLSQPIEGKGVGAMAGEIRSYVHSLPEGQRMGFIQKAIDSGDERTVGAVLGGVPYLSGITPEMQAVLLRQYHEKTNPRAAKQLRAAKAGLELLGERGGLIFKEMEKGVGAKQAKVQQLRAAKAAAEKSFVV